MTFTNVLREADDRSIANKVMQGWVTNNKDPMKLQRIQVRVHDLHDEIVDADLPWFVPDQMSASSGAANIGDHGPIPPVGTKVWVQFGPDGTQYHGTYGGGVATTQNQIPEFASASSDGTPITSAGNVKYDYSKNYPQASGSVDPSGTARAHDSKTDTYSHTHPSGTGSTTDGKGNHAFTVNGDANRSDNANASKLLPKGGTYAVFGDCTLYVSGNLTISAGGNVTINSLGSVVVSAKGTAEVKADGNVVVSSGGDVTVKASGKATVSSGGDLVAKSGGNTTVSSHGSITAVSDTSISLVAPAINSSVPITTPASGETLSPDTADASNGVVAPVGATQRTRPNPQVQQDDLTY